MLIAASVMSLYLKEVLMDGSMAALYRTDMAPMTAVCFFLMGLAAVCGALLWRTQERSQDDKNHHDERRD
jgi:hypothetical protein